MQNIINTITQAVIYLIYVPSDCPHLTVYPSFRFHFGSPEIRYNIDYTCITRIYLVKQLIHIPIHMLDQSLSSKMYSCVSLHSR